MHANTHYQFSVTERPFSGLQSRLRETEFLSGNMERIEIGPDRIDTTFFCHSVSKRWVEEFVTANYTSLDVCLGTLSSPCHGMKDVLPRRKLKQTGNMDGLFTGSI
ncbi:hypothetical protein NPIL_11661 [Nephila pilipes]|uniref:Uncharacterized protein n=1 Tax=Nephila pilipes TaxID=299642 RepID=A0A8X6MW28_NEPPI|nr:hypothetical protein NPIL_11661 [Nephila pilipes]